MSSSIAFELGVMGKTFHSCGLWTGITDDVRFFWFVVDEGALAECDSVLVHRVFLSS